MVNNVLSSLPTLINEKGYLFGIDMVGESTSSTVFVSFCRRYCGSLKKNSSGCMVNFNFFVKEGGAEITLEYEKLYTFSPIL